jgi:hypothetical protein
VGKERGDAPDRTHPPYGVLGAPGVSEEPRGGIRERARAPWLLWGKDIRHRTGI